MILSETYSIFSKISVPRIKCEKDTFFHYYEIKKFKRLKNYSIIEIIRKLKFYVILKYLNFKKWII